MKKIRMIVAAIIVLAIVGSAFTFKIKGTGAWCITTNLSSNHCTTYIINRMKTTDPFAPEFKYYPQWNGDPTECTYPDNQLCTATFRLTLD